MTTAQTGHTTDPNAISNAPVQHAFIVVGHETLFLVHMTNMWMEQHRYQCILRVTLPSEIKTAYTADRRAHPDAWHIIGNTAHDKLLVADLKRGGRTTYRASLWRGWPTAPGEPHWPWAGTPPVVADFQVTVDLVVYYRHFDFNQERPRTLTYVLFGRGREAHLQSYQIKQPDFDHIATLAGPPAWLPSETLEASVHVNFFERPAAPGGTIEPAPGDGRPRRYDVYCQPPVNPGTHYVQYAGFGPGRALTVDRTVFFGTFPTNNPDPCEPGAL